MAGWVKGIFTSISVAILGMAGGQGKLGGKGSRRFGITVTSIIAGGKRALPLLILPAILCAGYGENSVFMAWFNTDSVVRLFYGCFLALPFLFYGFKRFLFAGIILMGAFSIRAGSLGYISWFGDVLVEDLCRYGCLGLLISYNLFFRK